MYNLVEVALTFVRGSKMTEWIVYFQGQALSIGEYCGILFLFSCCCVVSTCDVL